MIGCTWGLLEGCGCPQGEGDMRDGEERLGKGWDRVENPSTAFGRQGQVRVRMVEQLHVYWNSRGPSLGGDASCCLKYQLLALQTQGLGKQVLVSSLFIFQVFVLSLFLAI